MQNKILPVLIAATLGVCGARAQDTGIVTPSSPAPAAQQQAATAQQPQVVMQAQAPAPNQVIYSPRLPSPTELTNVAAAQGLTVEQISQTATQVTAVYRYPNGQTNTVAYQLLPTSSAPASTTVVVPGQPTTVIYDQTPRVIYYDRYDYWPRYYYPPVSLSLGFGYSGGWGRGGHWGGGHYGGGHRWR